MTLEDFFTLTEIKNGLTVLSRVEELVAVMQKEKDFVVKNAGDATRQWAAVASTLSATENKSCLDLFIQLDGLWFIDRWLEDAQKFSNDTNDSCVEESLSVLLRALEKLHISSEKSVSSGIFINIKNLLDHNSARVQDRARDLFDSWKPETDNTVVHGVAENAGGSCGDNTDLLGEDGQPSASNISQEREVTITENQKSEDALSETLLSRNSDALQSEQVGDLNIQTQLNELGDVISEHSGIDDKPQANPSSAFELNPVLEDGSRNEENYTGSVEKNSTTDTLCSLVPQETGADEILTNSMSSDLPQDEIQTCRSDRSSDHSGVTEKLEIFPSNVPEPGAILLGDAISPEESYKEISLQDDCRDDQAGIYQNRSGLDSERTFASDFRSDMNKKGNYSSTLAFKVASQDGEYHPNALYEASDCGAILNKHKNLETTFSSRKDISAMDEHERSNSESEDDTTDSEFSEPILNSRRPKVIEERSDMELDYGIVDALEVARKVALEVEREMVGYRGPCSSSSDKISAGGIRNLGSPDSITGKHDIQTLVQPKEDQATQSHSTGGYSEELVHLRNIDNLDTEKETLFDLESSQVTEACNEAEGNTEKGLCDFDLNEEVCSDDVDHLANSISTPISVVSVSRPAVVPGLPLTPLQFEGTLGWRGSAATSAFRPASPRRISDGVKSLFSGGNSDTKRRISDGVKSLFSGGNSDTKRRQDIPAFDLNVAETGDEVGKQTVVSADLPGGKCLEETSCRREEVTRLDLNCVSDDGDASVLDLRLEARLFHDENGSNVSPASSSSSMLPLLKNIDLNDRPFVQIDSSEPHGLVRPSNVSGYTGPKPGASVISIMGTKVEVGRKDFGLETPSYPNGRAVEHASGGSLARTGFVLGMNTPMSYTQAPFFGYNGLTVGPNIPFTSAMYGPGGTIPYMVDSRGGSVVPQILGSTSAIPQPSYSQPPFIMSMSDAQSGLNGVGPSHSNFDLNSGFMIDGGVGRDSGGSRQFFLPVHNRTVEEQFRANSRPSSSGIGGKRKEPDGGWESYPFSYKQHQQPPWK